MRALTLLLALSMTLTGLACSDRAPTSRGLPLDGTAPDTSDLTDASAPEPDVAPLEPDAAPPEPGWLELNVQPRRSLYALTDSIQLDAVLFDVYGDPIENAEYEYEADPPDVVEISPDGAITAQTVGAVTVKSCAANLCDTAFLLIDDGPPQLTVDTPVQAAVFSGPDEQIIAITGRVDDLTPDVRLTVNGVVTDIAEDGTFATVLDADFGTTLIEVRADDGVSREIPEVLRDVLWAPQFVAAEGDRIAIPNVAAFRMDQALFDGGDALNVPDAAAELDLESLAQLLELVFALIDIEGLLNAEDLFGAGGAGFSIDRVDLGQPTIEFGITSTGLELFVRFGNVRIFTEGELNLQGQALDLTGHIDLAVVARIDVTIGLADRVTVEVSESAVAVESIDAEFAAAGLGALINIASSGITDVIQEAFTGVVDDALRAQVSDFLRTALLGIFGDLRSVPLQIDPMLPGVTPVDLMLSLVISDIQYTRRNWLRFVMDLAITHNQPPSGQENDPGVAQLLPTPWSDLSGDGIGISLRMSVFNALLHEVWRAGTLNLESEVPAELSGLIERVVVNAMLPPLIVPADAAANRPLEMQIGAMALDVVRPGGEQVDTYMLSIRSGLAVEFGDNTFQLLLDDVPRIRSQLVAAESDMPLPKALIEGALRGLVWDQLREGLTGGFDLGFSAIDIDPDTLAEFAPRINALAALPTFGEALEFRDSQLRLDGNLGLQIGLSAANPAPGNNGRGEAPPGRGE